MRQKRELSRRMVFRVHKYIGAYLPTPSHVFSGIIWRHLNIWITIELARVCAHCDRDNLSITHSTHMSIQSSKLSPILLESNRVIHQPYS